MTPPKRPQRPRPHGPLAVSMALHAVLLVLLVRFAPSSPRPPPRPIPVTLHILHAPSPAPAPLLPGAPATEPHRPAPRSGAASRPPSPPGSTPPAALPGAAAHAAARDPAPGSDAWLLERGLERGSGAAGPPLRPGPPAGAASGGQRQPGAVAPDAKGLVDAMLADVQARDRAAHAPHTYWSGIRARLEKDFDPGWEILEQGPKEGLGIVTGRAAADVVRQYLSSAERYARSGNPYGDKPGAPGAKSTLQDEVRRFQSRLPDEIQVEQELARPENTLFHRELTVLVRVVQSAEGSVQKVELVEGSGNRPYDRLVMARAKALAEESADRLGPPPEQGRETIWAFTTAFDRVPPVPIVGCAFDAYFVPQGCYYPLKTFARSRVELRSVR